MECEEQDKDSRDVFVVGAMILLNSKKTNGWIKNETIDV